MMKNKTIIALDLEGTLISNAISQIRRPHLFTFLVGCREVAHRIVMFTTVSESRFTIFRKLEQKRPPCEVSRYKTAA